MTPSKQIDTHISELTDWRGALITRLRKLVHEIDPEITEEFKWGTPVFIHNGMVVALGSFKDHVKINFFQGASLEDPHKLFNAGLEARKTRGIDFYKGDKVNEQALKTLLNSAVAFDTNK
ncbi:MAG: DUF1801 domain-containing protein [Candidatus Levybacteria bacterium]|nr:DUF1801 domain-containing protein [Candidatus Levybacteria bacterium]